MPAPKKQDPTQGQNDRWPGEALRKAGEEINDNNEMTKIPEIRPDAKRHEDNEGNASPA